VSLAFASTTASRNSIGSFYSYNWTSRLFPIERSSRRGRWCTRGSDNRAQASRSVVRTLTLFSSPSLMTLYDSSRSRDWVCPSCNRSNLECLPDPPQSNDTATSGSGSVGEVQTSSEAEVVPTPAEAIPPQTEVSVSEREAIPGGAEVVARRLESDDASSVDTSPHLSVSSAATSSQNISGSRQAGTASFRPSHTPRPPMLLDTAICVLLVLVFALLCRRVF
jgi:hypothetical protein